MSVGWLLLGIGCVVTVGVVILALAKRTGRRAPGATGIAFPGPSKPPRAVPSPPKPPVVPLAVRPPQPTPQATPARPRLSAMKFTDRSFAGPGEYLDAESIGDEIRFVLLWSTGPDEEETVGEAHHHSELEDLANHVVEGGARSANFLAWLKREPENPHDPKAVAVVALVADQMPETVSYLPRPAARQYGPLLAQIDEKTGREVACRGRVIVPKDDQRNFSVVLRLSPALLTEFLDWIALPEEQKTDATREAWKRRKRPVF